MNGRRAFLILRSRFFHKLGVRYSNYPIGTVIRTNSYCKRRFHVAFGLRGNPPP